MSCAFSDGQEGHPFGLIERYTAQKWYDDRVSGVDPVIRLTKIEIQLSYHVNNEQHAPGVADQYVFDFPKTIFFLAHRLTHRFEEELDSVHQLTYPLVADSDGSCRHQGAAAKQDTFPMGSSVHMHLCGREKRAAGEVYSGEEKLADEGSRIHIRRMVNFVINGMF